MAAAKILFIFRRDLRIDDNFGLAAALEHGETVFPCFILDDRQVKPHPYRSLPGLQFLLRSLRELDAALRDRGGRLQIFTGKAEAVIEKLLSAGAADAVYFNRDYTPFSRDRDLAIKAAGDRAGVPVKQFGDALLQEPESVSKNDGGPYTVFTPFSKKLLSIPVRRPRSAPDGRFASTLLPGAAEDPARVFSEILPAVIPGLVRSGGRSEALEILSELARLKDYKDERDFPALSATSGLSAHHKFGTVSIRETYHAALSAFGPGHTFITELAWRDFFHHIAFNFPHVFGAPFYSKFAGIEWSDNEEHFQRWCCGQTGFPIVDAGMRELNETGFMHNRVRMVTASFLIKDLQIDWQRGERYFAERLLDYDPCVNNGNWQWAASTGCDAQPYFRIFNPWLQQDRFDAQAEYIKRWVPELSHLGAREIHKLRDPGAKVPKGYFSPMVDHAEAKGETERMYGKALGG